MIFFWFIIYNVIFIPLSFMIYHISYLFSKKSREGIQGRRRSWREVRKYRTANPHKPLFLIHSASLGEFEQARPVIKGLKALRPDIGIIASFTSPSGFKHAKRVTEVDLYIYLPLDTFLRTRKFIQKLKPRKIIFVTYELWMNLILNARRHKVKTYLMSARVRRKSTKWFPVVKTFFGEIYRCLDYIYAISQEDKHSVESLIGSVPIKVLNLGDTRYDQVFHRAQKRVLTKIPQLFPSGFVLICGSIWPQDARHILPAIFKLMQIYQQFRVILAPHEPNEYALETLEDNFEYQGYQTTRFSEVDKTDTKTAVVLIDSVGVLAELYHQADVAFIGGSFRGSIHNVMEPAAATIPVLFGPTFHNSREAKLLLESGGGRCCANSEDLYCEIAHMINERGYYEHMAITARQVIIKNLGASARTVKEILESE